MQKNTTKASCCHAFSQNFNEAVAMDLKEWKNGLKTLYLIDTFTVYFICFGQNPNIMIDKPPALEGSSTSEAFAKHMNTLCAARQAFVQTESSEKVRRALRHKIRVPSKEFKPGDKVYYKREMSNKWKVPGIVIGQNRKVVFVRHGSTFCDRTSKQTDQNR